MFVIRATPKSSFLPKKPAFPFHFHPQNNHLSISEQIHQPFHKSQRYAQTTTFHVNSRAHKKIDFYSTRQRGQENTSNKNKHHPLTLLQLTRKQYAGIGALLLVIFCLVMHCFFPDRSLVDYILKMVYGGPYRNYVLLKRGAFMETFSEDDPDDLYWVYIPHEMHFEAKIPEHFVQPGIVIREDTTYKTKGWCSMTDAASQKMLIEWKDIMKQLKENEQTRFTPLDEILKGCAYMHVKELHDTLGENNVHVQRSEFISMENKDNHLDPLPFKDKAYGNMVCLVNKVHNPYKNEDAWESDLWFLHTPYVFHVRLTYPTSLSNRAANEQDNEAALDQLAHSLSRSQEFQQQVREKIKLTSDPKEISLMLRNQLINVYMQNNFKKHGAMHVDLKNDKEKEEKENTDTKKKGWFW